ncbi:unnamed protein product [Kuraishia capsulata CBS 1993]|uniref:Zn(2)-C6 fungal-type domain-containing protein n=1 Tax=Kuraishia capsulata CBS 1993 TaxID=1382522 RepID=W6MK16_9ASCO|nr:uncharacterized protein KUCA_T00002304001 [Kuraishia capsulata CBS 1993]CDK26333.1 unnamed protein product [Kuraishia capsulata CBS 1993]
MSETNSKRGKIASLACIQCRKRRCRCDGGQPACAQCQRRGQEGNCVYSATGDRRKRSQKVFDEAMERMARLEETLREIAKGTEASSYLVEHLQNDHTFLESLLRGPQRSEITNNSSQGDTAEIELESKSLTVDAEGKIHFYGDTSNVLRIRQQTTSKAVPPAVSSLTVEAVQIMNPHIDPVIAELLELYFCWQHSYYNIFDKKLFLRDMNTEGSFCSKFLLNALLSHAAHLSDRPELRLEAGDPSTAGHYFYNEALRLLDDELENRSLTTVQGLLLLASKEAGVGKSSIGWVHSGMAFRMAVDLGLHLDSAKLKESGLVSEEEIAVRNATFWGCYLFDQGWSAYLGRPSVIRIHDVGLALPQYHSEPSTKWVPFCPHTDIPVIPINFYPENTLVAILKLYLILETVMTKLDAFRGKKTTTSKNRMRQDYKEFLQSSYEQLRLWERNLPAYLRDTPSMTHPALLMIHTMYHATLIFLFRPFLKVSANSHWPTNSVPNPVQRCQTSARKILELMRKYKDLYRLRRILNLATYVTSTASTVFLALAAIQKNSGSHEPSQESELASCLEFLSDVSVSWFEAIAVHDELEAQISSFHEREQTAEEENRNETSYEALSTFWIPNFDEFLVEFDEGEDWSMFA